MSTTAATGVSSAKRPHISTPRQGVVARPIELSGTRTRPSQGS
jgi:hypothetical protein